MKPGSSGPTRTRPGGAQDRPQGKVRHRHGRQRRSVMARRSSPSATPSASRTPSPPVSWRRAPQHPRGRAGLPRLHPDRRPPSTPETAAGRCSTSTAGGGCSTPPSTPGAGHRFCHPHRRGEEIVADLIQYGEVEPAWIGIVAQELDEEFAQYLKYPEKGAMINSVEPDSPAREAGLREGYVLLAVGAKKSPTSTTTWPPQDRDRRRNHRDPGLAQRPDPGVRC